METPEMFRPPKFPTYSLEFILKDPRVPFLPERIFNTIEICLHLKGLSLRNNPISPKTPQFFIPFPSNHRLLTKIKTMKSMMRRNPFSQLTAKQCL